MLYLNCLILNMMFYLNLLMLEVLEFPACFSSQTLPVRLHPSTSMPKMQGATQALNMSRSASAPHSALISIVMLFARSACTSPSLDFHEGLPCLSPSFLCREVQSLIAQIGRDAEALPGPDHLLCALSLSWEC